MLHDHRELTLIDPPRQAAQLPRQLHAGAGDVGRALAQLRLPRSRAQLLFHQILDEWRGDREDIEFGIEQRASSLIHAEHLEQHDEVGRHLQMVVADDREKRSAQLIDVDLIQRLAEKAIEHVVDVAHQRHPVCVDPGDAERFQAIDRLAGVLAGDGVEQIEEIELHRFGNAPDHAEIEHADLAAFENEHVSGGADRRDKTRNRASRP